jgi:hypothetical protein
MRRLGRYQLKPFDVAKCQPSYTHRLIAYLKSHGALAAVWQPGDWEHFQSMVEDKRRIVEEERRAERDASGRTN